MTQIRVLQDYRRNPDHHESNWPGRKPDRQL